MALCGSLVSFIILNGSKDPEIQKAVVVIAR